jgi:hypothetical protein
MVYQLIFEPFQAFGGNISAQKARTGVYQDF